MATMTSGVTADIGFTDAMARHPTLTS